jgi:hypothetical protein
MESLEKKVWWDYVEPDLQELLLQSVDLLRVTAALEEYHDYSFVVFPASKAYEGFLKKFFYDMGFIDEPDYYGTRFRVGKALNPSIDAKESDNWWVYNKIVKYCSSNSLPDKLWAAWKKCRNEVFHWFPGQSKAISRDEARDCLKRIFDAMDEVFVACDIKAK